MSESEASTLLDDSTKGRELLVQGIQSLFLSDKYSDVTITCGSKRWPCHRNIICPRSSFFAAACKREWQEGKAVEVPLKEDEPQVIKEMLRYLYTGQYHDQVEDSQDDAIPSLLLHVHLHTLGDKYDILDLCKLADQKFVVNAGDKWNTEEFASAIAEMYETSPDTKTVMHKTVVDIASKHAKELYSQAQGIRFTQVASETPRFMSELFGTLVTTNDLAGKDEARYACSNCQRTFVLEKMESNRYYRCPQASCNTSSRLGSYWRVL